MKFFTTKRLSLLLSCTGVALMGIDILMTRSFFTHIGELMIASLLCLSAGLALDHVPARGAGAKPDRKPGATP